MTLTQPQVISVATYNILHGYHSDLILENIKFLIEKNVDVICIQEADQPFENSLNNFLKVQGWEATQYLHNTKACNLVVIWNPLRLNLQSTKNILLPALSKPSFVQRITHLNEKLQRGALSVRFLCSNKSVEITNAHLGWEGGLKQTLLQLTYLRDSLRKEETTYAILAGDFNTFTPALFRKFKIKKVEKILGEKWINAFPKLVWSYDVSYYVPHDGYNSVAQILNKLHIKMQSALDYIFSRNLIILNSEMLDLPGSDHRPLIVKFQI